MSKVDNEHFQNKTNNKRIAVSKEKMLQKLEKVVYCELKNKRIAKNQ